MDYQNLLDTAAEICVTSHRGQRDKMGKAYFLHPMRVAMRCVRDEEKIVALLHDTIEDAGVTPQCLAEAGFPQEIVDAVLSVTKIEGETYDDFIMRAKRNPIGRVVKMHDLEDNLDIFRLEMLTPDMAARFTKYLAAYRFLQVDEPEEPVAEEVVPTVKEEEEPCAPIKYPVASELATPMEEEPRVPIVYEEIVAHKSLRDLYTALREEENKKILYRSKHTGGTNYMRDRLIIRDRERLIINESSVFETLCKLGHKIGFDTMAESKVVAKKSIGKFRLVKEHSDSNFYKRIESGWYVLANIPVATAAIALNELFEEVKVNYIATMVDR